FPLIQFIVTTHSPQVISTVKRESVRLLEQDEKGNGLASIPPGRPTASQVMMYCTA
ncbi:ATP-binding protein, partial [Salmonella enterica subsp. enterica serovar Enteritidis str. 50-5646]